MCNEKKQTQALNSDEVAGSTAEKLKRERLRRAAHKLGGSLADKDIPGWESTESTIEWVRALRRGSAN
jgi:acetylglutamate kinase